jgi:hypothetical protein
MVELIENQEQPLFYIGSCFFLSVLLLLNYLYLFFSQPVKLVHQFIDMLVSGLDLALEQCLLLAGSGFCKLLMQREHRVNQASIMNMAT